MISVLAPTEHGEAVPVFKNEVQCLTSNCSTCPREALALGLAQYLARLKYEWHGKTLQFERVFNVWAEPEDVRVFPSVAIVSSLPGSYEDRFLTPTTVKTDDGTNKYLRMASEFKQSLAIVVYTTSSIERSGFVNMLENAFELSDDRSGLRLALPYYYGVHATYEKDSNYLDDDRQAASANRRRAIMTVTGNCPQFVPVGLIPNLRARACVITEDPQDPQDG